MKIMNQNDKVISCNEKGIIVRNHSVNKFYKYELVQTQQQTVRKKEVINTCEKINLNAVQREMYRRLMYGLDNYSNEERAVMSPVQITKIIKEHEKAKRYLHIMKAKKYYEGDTKLLNAIFPHCPTGTKDSDWFLFMPKHVTLNKLGIGPKEVINEFMRRRLLPQNFYELTPTL